MAARKSPGTDFESRVFDLLFDRLDKQDVKLDQIHQQTQKTNGRVTKLEDETRKIQSAVFPESEPKTLSQLPPWYRDPKLLGFASLVVTLLLAGLSVFANLKGYTVPGIE